MLKNCVERYAQANNAALSGALRDNNEAAAMFGGGSKSSSIPGPGANSAFGDMVAPTPTFFGSGGAVS